jgi:hypothetical protein
MSVKTIKVGIESDAIEKLSKVSVDQAIEELIWNSIDAEAGMIEIELFRQDLEGVNRIVVRDDGHGISIDDAEKIFGSIGGSSKRLCRRSPKLDRPYHGKEGSGRYKAFSLGRHIQWKSRVLTKGKVSAFTVTLDLSHLQSAEIGPVTDYDGTTGCEVVIDDLHDAALGLDNESKLASIAHRLAPYLIVNSGIRIVYDGHTLDVEAAVNRSHTFHIDNDANGEGVPLSFDLQVLEWNKSRKSTLFWCDKNGVPLDETSIDLKGMRFPISAYILSDSVRELSDAGSLAAGDLNPTVRRIKELARGKVRDYVRQRQAEEAKYVVERIRNEGIYPYSHGPTTPVELAEQQVFDICAATIHENLPQFESSDKSSRQFTYRLLREALESSPTHLRTILKEVLKLSEEQQENLIHLLGKTSLGAIIHTAKTVSDRLSFINGLEQILHDASIRKHLKERVHLHRILVEELWIFGDEYALGSDDVSLKTVLHEHRAILGLLPLNVEAASEITKLDDIPDLLLWRQYLRGSDDQFEHLVIELKRPTVKISQLEISQVKRYATKVLSNKHFDKEKTHWTFVALSDGVSEDAKEDVTQRDREPGHVTSGNHYDVWVLTWSQIIQKAKIRHNWIQQRLQYQVSDNSEGMQYLRRRFSHLLPNEAVDDPTLK